MRVNIRLYSKDATHLAKGFNWAGNLLADQLLAPSATQRSLLVHSRAPTATSVVGQLVLEFFSSVFFTLGWSCLTESLGKYQGLV